MISGTQKICMFAIFCCQRLKSIKRADFDLKMTVGKVVFISPIANDVDHQKPPDEDF